MFFFSHPQPNTSKHELPSDQKEVEKGRIHEESCCTDLKKMINRFFFWGSSSIQTINLLFQHLSNFKILQILQEYIHSSSKKEALFSLRTHFQVRNRWTSRPFEWYYCYFQIFTRYIEKLNISNWFLFSVKSLIRFIVFF